MTRFVIVDTDIIIDASRGTKEAVSHLRGLKSSAELAISAITKMELIVGCRQKTDLLYLERFIRHFQVLMISELISGKALELLQQYPTESWLADRRCVDRCHCFKFELSPCF